MIEGVAAGAQKNQLNGSPGAAIAPKALVDRGNVAVGQCEVALHIEFRQAGGQAILSHIAKFQARHPASHLRWRDPKSRAGMLPRALAGSADNSQHRLETL